MNHLAQLITVLAISGLLAIPANAQTYDLVINHGRVIGPETKLDAVRHLGITGGQIATVSQEPLDGSKVIDASGLIVAPGFIDFHARSLSEDDRNRVCVKRSDLFPRRLVADAPRDSV
jgi:adenine deaminase